jgi:hypothetical protein
LPPHPEIRNRRQSAFRESRRVLLDFSHLALPAQLLAGAMMTPVHPTRGENLSRLKFCTVCRSLDFPSLPRDSMVKSPAHRRGQRCARQRKGGGSPVTFVIDAKRGQVFEARHNLYMPFK